MTNEEHWTQAKDEYRSILMSVIPKDCYWEDMDNLTNTPVEYVLSAMELYAESVRLFEREKVIEQVKKLMKLDMPEDYLLRELESLKIIDK